MLVHLVTVALVARLLERVQVPRAPSGLRAADGRRRPIPAEVAAGAPGGQAGRAAERPRAFASGFMTWSISWCTFGVAAITSPR